MADERVSSALEDPRALLRSTLASDRVHSAYLLSGSGEEPRRAALDFVRGLACTGSGSRPCESCPACQRSSPREPISLDGAGRKGPLYRHVGDHPELFWVERGEADTRVRIGQVRALQQALRLGRSGARRAAVIADAEWLNQEAQNALLRLLEEPPEGTTLVLVATTAAGLLATVRSRCQRVVFRAATEDPLADPERAELAARLAAVGSLGVPEVLAWAEEFRGARAAAAERVEELLLLGSAQLRARVGERVERVGGDGAPPIPELDAELDAFGTLQDCRKVLAQRNANPQMVAERALLALRRSCTP